jgi:DNA-binding LacI/PurR family transcriptional regulator
MTDGVLVNYTHFIPQWLVDRIHEDRAPAVWINSKNEIESVRPDDFKAGYDATKQLIELGHTRIAYAVHYTEHYSAVERGDGYVAAMSEAGLRPRWELHEQARGEEGPAWVSIASEWFRSPDRPTAIIAYGAIPGLSVAYAAEKSQLRIPEDLSIVMFDDDQVQNRSTGKRFSTWRVPQHEVADEATRMLLQMIEDPDRPVEPISVPFEKLEDCSTARPLSRLNGT